MKRLTYSLLFLIIVMAACQKSDDNHPPIENGLYFPPTTSGEWQNTAPEELGWDTDSLEALYTFLSDHGTRAFLILKDGKIVAEKYWGKNILNTGDFNAESNWYWASAGKTLSAFLIGVAQQDGLLSISDKTSDYLGEGWTSLTKEKEELITIRHQLTMTTGLDYTVNDTYCTDPECLQYKTDAGQQWYYHNAPYTLLKDVIASASGMTDNEYTHEILEVPTGMSGTWIYNGVNNVYYSVPRDMARFGLLILNKGTWDETELLSDQNYFSEMTTTSQNINPAYGYLWWLNGTSKTMMPGITIPLNTSISPDAPEDLIVAAGKNGQFLDVIPSMNMVVVRMGEAPDEAQVPIIFHNQMWQKLNPVIGRQPVM
ncbi:serine hydrolase domain-containing protein [Maribellus sediminis]|uniref:serine hydrolase domain-containing protein n=1 Tax=Maribellus sediminis TaxID=2696285 RepID=UPI001431A9DB|nr:serine hydrolase [Maribellus sediminis]